MAVIENRFVCDLSKPVQAQALKGNVFSLDNLGSRLSVLIYENGQPATISGSITANCILPDGSTVNVNGGLTTENGGSKAYVDVPQSCLLIPGILKIAIKCTSSSVITTLAAIVANVYMTKTDNVITPSQQIITDWNAEISSAIATQNAAIATQDGKIDDLKNAMGDNLKVAEDSYKTNDIISLFNIVGGVGNTGIPDSSSSFKRTTHIRFLKDWKVSFKLKGGSSKNVLSFYDNSFVYQSGIAGSGASFVTSEFTATADGYIMLCTNDIANSYANVISPLSVLITNQNNQLTDLQDQSKNLYANITTIGNNVSQTNIAKFVSYIGAINTSGAEVADNGYYRSLLFALPKGWTINYSGLRASSSYNVISIYDDTGTYSTGVAGSGAGTALSGTYTAQSNCLFRICQHNSYIGSIVVSIVSPLVNEIDNLDESARITEDAVSLKSSNMPTTWAQGSISSDGTDAAGTTRGRSDYIHVLPNGTLTVTPNSYYCQWFRYNKNKVLIDKSSFSGSWSNSVFVTPTSSDETYYRILVRNSDSTTEVITENIDTTIAFTSKVSAEVNMMHSTARFVLPSSFVIAGGLQYNIYYQNIIQNANIKTIPLIRARDDMDDYSYFSRLEPGVNGHNSYATNMQIYLYDTENVTIQSDRLEWTEIPNSAGTGLSKTVLLIGDSLTAQHDAIATDLATMFENDPMSVTFIGTQGTGNAKHEGHGGWSAEIYTTQSSYSDVPNPFWNPSSSKFDFSYYMTNNSFSGVDYVFINLGSNSIQNDPADTLSAYNEMIASIKAYNADVRIGIWLPPVRAVTPVSQRFTIMNKSLDVNRLLIANFDYRQNENLYLVPVYFNLDPMYDYKLNEVDVSARNSEYKFTIVTDFLHPALVGFQKFADVIYAYIKYFGQLDS